MKNVINKVKNSKGFVSIEAILVIGVVVVLAGLILLFFNNRAESVQSGAADQMTTGQTSAQATVGDDIVQ